MRVGSHPSSPKLFGIERITGLSESVAVSPRRSSSSGGQAAGPAPARADHGLGPLYPEILRSLPFGVAVLQIENPNDAKSFRIFDLNPAAAEIAGSAPEYLRGRTLADFPKLLTTALPGGCLAAFHAGEPRDLGEISYGDKRVRQGIYSVRVLPLSGNFLGVVLENVTERKQAERALQEREERLRLLIGGVQEYAIFQLDPGGHMVSWNAGAERLKGYSADEIIGKHLSVFYPPEDVAEGKPQRILAEAARTGHIQDEGWRVRKDGSRFFAHIVLTALKDMTGSVRGFVKLTRDITAWREKEEALTKTKELLELRVEQRAAVLAQVNHELRTEIIERQRAEEQLKSSLEQLRALTARVQSVREDERSNIAREIHDELGQACTAIKMDLSLIGSKLAKTQAKLRRRIESSIKLVDEMIATLRRIAQYLRPRTLDDLGLSAALEWQAQEFQNRTGIECQLTLPPGPLALDRERSTAMFRIFQESLTNVARHAHASRVEAGIALEPGQILMHVSDNGVGFDPNEVRSKRSLGLVGMKERALLLNGSLELTAAPGAGTTLTLRIPLVPETPPTSGTK